MTDDKYWHSSEVREVAESLIGSDPGGEQVADVQQLQVLQRDAPATAEGCKRIASMQKLPAKVAATAAGTSMRAQGPQDVNVIPRPVYVMCISWVWWQHAEPIKREALVFHELCHIDLDGRIVPHSVSEHFAVVRRYGKWQPGLEQLDALFDLAETEQP